MKPSDDETWTKVERSFFAAAPPRSRTRSGTRRASMISGAPSATSAARAHRLATTIGGPGMARSAARSQGWGPARPARVAHDRPRRWRCGRERPARGADGVARLVAALSLRRVGRRRVVFALMGAMVAAGSPPGASPSERAGSRTARRRRGNVTSVARPSPSGARRLLRISGGSSTKRAFVGRCSGTACRRREPKAARASKTCRPPHPHIARWSPRSSIARPTGPANPVRSGRLQQAVVQSLSRRPSLRSATATDETEHADCGGGRTGHRDIMSQRCENGSGGRDGVRRQRGFAAPNVRPATAGQSIAQSCPERRSSPPERLRVAPGRPGESGR